MFQNLGFGSLSLNFLFLQCFLLRIISVDTLNSELRFILFIFSLLPQASVPQLEGRMSKVNQLKYHCQWSASLSRV